MESYVITRSFSVSCRTHMAKKLSKPTFPLKSQREAQKNYKGKKFFEILKAQKERPVWGKMAKVCVVHWY